MGFYNLIGIKKLDMPKNYVAGICGMFLRMKDIG